MASINLIQISTEPPTKSDSKFDAFFFIQGADSQYGMIENYLKKLENPKWTEEIELSEKLVAACNNMEPKPKFMVVCGDLVDAWPGTEAKRLQVADFKKVFAKLDKDIPLVCVCGNHDIGNEPTMESIIEYKKDFGDDYFYFVVNDVLFIVINSQFYEHRANVEEYAKQQDQWLEEMLKKCKMFKYTIVFEHIPWFLKNFDEDDEYFNINKDIRLEWLEKFHQAGVSKIMCGHYHRNAGGWYRDMELIVTSAIGAQIGDDLSGARIVTVLDDSITHNYYALDDLPSKLDID